MSQLTMLIRASHVIDFSSRIQFPNKVYLINARQSEKDLTKMIGRKF